MCQMLAQALLDAFKQPLQPNDEFAQQQQQQFNQQIQHLIQQHDPYSHFTQNMGADYAHYDQQHS